MILPKVTAGLALIASVSACASFGSSASARPDSAQMRVDTVVVERPHDNASAMAEVKERVARLQLRLLEKDVLLQDLQAQLDEARREVVRNMAKLQSQASRAEAASGIAEAEIALEALRRSDGGQDLPEASQAAGLLTQSSAEFEQDNFGGALYLAGEARSLARSGQGRLRSGVGRSMRAGESRFAVPVPLRTLARSNVRDGPGLDHGVLFTLSESDLVVGQSYTSEWVRIVDEQGRVGWIFHTLVSSPEG